MLRQDDYQKAQLVTVGWKHGKEYGGHLAPCIIMSCIANRQRLGWGTWLDVIDDVPSKCATIEQPTGVPQVWEPGFVRLLHEVEAIYDSSKDYSNGALYWFDSSKEVTNTWFKEKILGDMETHKKVGDMNSLIFMR